MAQGQGRGGLGAAVAGAVALLRGIAGVVSVAVLLAVGLAVAVVAGLAAVAISGHRLALPRPAVAWVEARLAAALGEGGTLSLDGLELWLGADRMPRVALRGLALSEAGGGGRADLPELEVGLLGAALLRGEVRPETVRLPGASVTLRREADGRLGLAFGVGSGGGLVASGSVAEILDAVDRMLAAGPLAGIGRIEADDLSLVFDDLATGRAWRLVDGRLALTQGRGETTIALSFALAGADGGAPAQAHLWFRTARGSPEAVLFAEVSRIAAAELAAEVPALAGLGLLDAPVSAAFRGAVDASGAIDQVWGRLMAGPGRLRPRDGVAPVPFERAVADFTLVPGRGRIELSEIAVDSAMLRLRASGWADPEGGAAPGLPEGVVAQLSLAELALDPEGVFAAPLSFTDGVIDLRLSLAPLALTIGRIAATGSAPATGAPAPSLRGSGRVAAAEGGWEAALDVAVDALAHDRLLAAWPLGFAPMTRAWLARNLLTGTLRDVRAALRLAPGGAPVIALGADFEGAEVRVMPAQPPVRDGAGYIALFDNAYALVLDAGVIDAGAGGPIDVAGTVFRVPDVTLRPAAAEIDLVARGSLAAAEALLGAAPFSLRGPGGGPLDLGGGRVAVTARIALPLIAALRGPDVAFTLAGEVTDFRSDTLVSGQVLAAERLEVTAASGGEIAVAGNALLSGVPVQGRWARPVLPGGEGGAVAGRVELSARLAEAFGLPFAAGSIEGAAPADFAIALAPDAPPQLRLSSDLAGLGLRLPELGWAKPAGARGRLELEGRLGRPVDLARLSIEAPGLAAEGSVRLAADGSLATARFARVRLGGWLDGAVDLAGRGRDRPAAVSVRGGTLDLRALPAGGGGAAAGRVPTPVELALDRLVVSETIALTGFRASLVSAGGLSGGFRGLVNGEVVVEGQARPQDGRTALRVTATDAGAVLRAAGLFGRAQGGALDLVLVPRRDGPGQEGRLKVTGGLRVQDAPALAALLNAMSVVGLLEQLAGPGIAFSEVEAGLRLTPAGIEISEGTAVGPSMGVTLAGVYAAETGRVDLRGVVSPFYMLNAAAGLFSRRGEGLFGFTWRVAGPVAAPRVEVNPLSVLTPGMFRDIFRTAPPRLAE